MAAAKKTKQVDTPAEVGVSTDEHEPEKDPLVGPDGRRYATVKDAQAVRDGGGPLDD